MQEIAEYRDPWYSHAAPLRKGPHAMYSARPWSFGKAKVTRKFNFPHATRRSLTSRRVRLCCARQTLFPRSAVSWACFEPISRWCGTTSCLTTPATLNHYLNNRPRIFLGIMAQILIIYRCMLLQVCHATDFMMIEMRRFSCCGRMVIFTVMRNCLLVGSFTWLGWTTKAAGIASSIFPLYGLYLKYVCRALAKNKNPSK